MSSNAARTSSERSLPVVSDDEARALIASMLLRDGAVDTATLERARRLMGKLGEEATLFDVLARTSGLDAARVLECVRRVQPDLPIGVLLTELGLLTRAQLREALQQQVQGGFERRIGEILIAERMLGERDLTRVLAAQSGYASEEPEIEACDPALLARVSPASSERFGYLPLRVEPGATVVAFVDPLSQAARTEAARALGTSLRPVMMSRTTLDKALATLARRREPLGADEAGAAARGSASECVAGLLGEALAQGASDIHIEPLPGRVRVRLRIDGILHEQAELERDEFDALLSHLKGMAELDVAERRRHQSGRIAFEDPASGRSVELRASFYVTVDGERVVLRVPNRSGSVPALDELGMSGPVLERFRWQALEAPGGVVVVAGPARSGRTTTLYGCIAHLDDGATSIITLEDPVELAMDGVARSTTDDRFGRGFEESIRHVARQDPDVIVLGGLDGADAVAGALQAARCGRKVLTTLHAEDSIGALLQLAGTGRDGLSTVSAVSGVLAQRLPRRVCPSCARPGRAGAAELRLVGWDEELAGEATFAISEGCAACRFTGYAGRLAVFEALVPSEAVREALLERASVSRIRRVAVETAGFVTLLEDGLLKAARGETTLSEIRRTLPQPTPPRALQELRDLTGGTPS